eukprot:4985094-Pyramimonas_sp.AAC.1
MVPIAKSNFYLGASYFHKNALPFKVRRSLLEAAAPDVLPMHRTENMTETAVDAILFLATNLDPDTKLSHFGKDLTRAQLREAIHKQSKMVLHSDPPRQTHMRNLSLEFFIEDVAVDYGYK